MLEHLKAATFPKAHSKNILYFDSYRITVLDGGLFRIEKCEERSFNDKATLHIWHRNMPPVPFTSSRDGNSLTVSTDRASLTLCRNFEESFVTIEGKKIPLNNDGNLLGTYRTLDCYDGEYNIRDGIRLKLECGVCSKSGVAIIDDTNALILGDDGRPEAAHECIFDIYVFAYGNDYRAAVKALYMICGSTPMLPRFAFGNWWSRYHAYSDREYLHLLDKFEENGIPLTVATLDMDWHWSDNVDADKQISAQGKNTADRGTFSEDGKVRIGWTGYSWNTNLFPDYRAFLRELRERGLKATLNLHPASGIRYYEDMYEEMATAMGIDPATEKAVPFNISDPHFIEEYFKILHHPYERDGVDFWWIDWQQGTKTEMAGLDPLWALNHYHYLDNGRINKYPLIMSRYAGIGSHRYPIGFSGDTTISWDTLKLMPYFTATAANCGYTWWGHDIGGHHLGVKDDELYLRFLQFAVFNPINRFHSTNSEIINKEPWNYEGGIGELAKKMLVLRHRMIPFLYSFNRRTHTEGVALCEPMYYQYPEYEESYKFKYQYMFGEQLLVAPVTEKSREDGLSVTEVFLPSGEWTDIFTNEVYRVKEGGAVICAVRPLDSIPVFARSGSVLPLSCDGGNGHGNPVKLEVKIYDGCGEYSLFEDRQDAEAFTKFLLTSDGETQKVKIQVEGDRDVIPAGRSITLSFPNIVIRHPADFSLGLDRPAPNVQVLKNGSPIEAYVKDYAEVSVTISDFDPSDTYEVSVSVEPLDELTCHKRSVINTLRKTHGQFSTRNFILEKVIKYDDLSRIIGRVQLSGLSKTEKLRLTETILYEQ